MFERTHHQHIAIVLRSLDAALLRRLHCYFGGGTAIALRHGEYRQSVDIDFMVSNIGSYRELRKILGSSAGISPLLKERGALEQTPEIRSDQYGIRTWLAVAGQKIKFEIIFEARIDLDSPRKQDEILGVATLTPVDMAASKLLANADRWADDSVLSRDLIDLAMLDLTPATWHKATDKAVAAYGEAIYRDLTKALEKIKNREDWLDRCLRALSIKIPKVIIVKHLETLQRLAQRS